MLTMQDRAELIDAKLLQNARGHPDLPAVQVQIVSMIP
jgi:hypothetical protein